MNKLSCQLADEITRIVGSSNFAQEADECAEFLLERRGRFESAALGVVFPASAQQVSAIVKLCQREKIPIVPQGGNTGVCGGAVSSPEHLIVNLKRMNAIRSMDAIGYTMVAESGCILANLQQAASDRDLYFPLSLGAEGTCQIGGNLSTNAGGVNVLRYGSARDQVLGLEVVLPDGEIWSGLNALRKNNSGYDLKNAFIGAEGTLGIITATVLKLYPKPAHRSTALIAVESVEKSVELFARTRKQTSDFASSFELMSRECVECAFKNIPECRDFFPAPYPWYVLLELGDSSDDGISQSLNETLLGCALADGIILDALLASSEQQSQQMWRLREAIVECQLYEGKGIKSDVSVPLARIAEFCHQAVAELQSLLPGVRTWLYGHIGDGNIHLNLSRPLDLDEQEFFSRWDEATSIIHAIASRLNGSFSAEHGVGLLKLDDMVRYKSPVELNLMRAIKQALDPNQIMNPGKVLP